MESSACILKYHFKTVLGVFLMAYIFVVIDGESSVQNPGLTDSCYCLEEVVSGLYSPTSAHFPSVEDGEPQEILVVEQRGVIKSIKGGKTTTFMDIRDRVLVTNNYGDSRGLLSAAFSPDFEKDGKFYVYYIREVGGKEYAYISQFTASGGRVDSSTERFLLRVYQPFKHGNGGPMFFGDDGFLYIVTGDGGAEDDVLGNAQNKNSFHGSILRIDVTNSQDFSDGESGIAKMYSIPKDNPFLNSSDGHKEIFAVGFRNPWGCSVDSSKLGGDGRIFCADTGTDKFDEVNLIEKGKNYGWNVKEGLDCLNKSTCAPIENEGVPIFEFQHISQHALVGGFVYRGSRLGWMKGKGYYTFADIVTGETYYIEEDKASKQWIVHGWALCEINKCPAQRRARPLRHIFAFAQDKGGEIYMLMMDQMTALKPSGKMFRVAEMRSSSMKTPGLSLVQSMTSSLFVLFFVSRVSR